jgi:predicted GIY-YIG superfamily endonuclease
MTQYGIYKISSKIDDRLYIGSTALTFNERWRRHMNALIGQYHHNHKLQNFFNKYGLETLEFEKLEKFDDNFSASDRLEMVQKLEQKWLDKVKPFGKKGFNLQSSVSGGRPGVEIIRVSLLDSSISEYSSITSLAKELACKTTQIHKVLSGRAHRYKNWTFFYKRAPPYDFQQFVLKASVRKWPTVSVVAINKHTGDRQHFSSIKAAGITLKVSKENISAALRGLRESVGDYKFERCN